MLRQILLLSFISLSSFALEIAIDSAKEDFIKYSTLHISDKEKFVCQEIKDHFDRTTEVICAFSKKPSEDIKNIENDFLRVHGFYQKGTYFISVKPIYKIKLYANIFDLSKDATIFSVDVKLANSWSMIAYREKLPLIKNDAVPEMAINFPFYLEKDKLPYVGSLDLQGKPVSIKKVEDVTEYLKIKRYYKQKRYDEAVELIDEVLEKYPHTLFRPELIYYKVKLYNRLKDYENVISYAKEFLREYSGDENIPEVLSLIANAYAQIGQNTDADYFFDRLFSEHRGNVYAQKGYIYKGEMLESSGATKEAINYYKKALYETADVDVAALAAYHLTELYLDRFPKKAQEYAEKILAAKPSFFMNDMKKSQKMMQAFADKGLYKTAAAIADALLQKMGPSYDEYEEFLKDKALWLAKTKDTKKALAALQDYLKKFPDGDYVSDVEVAKDGLFFDNSDANNSAKLKEYDSLIEEYAGDEIAQRALYEKAKLLLAEKRYEDVLALRDKLKELEDKYEDINTIIKEAAMGLMDTSLAHNNCKNVLVVANDYNITLSKNWDDGVYSCAMKGGDFQLSKAIASKNLHSKDIQERKKWLYRYAKVDFETGNYTEAIGAAKDLIALLQNPKKSPYKDIYRYLFDAYERLGESENMIDAMAKIEDIFGIDYRDIDRYVSMITLGGKLKDDNMIIKYATKVMKIQKRSNSHAQTPYVEFALYDAYMRKNDYSAALKVIRSLDNAELTKNQRARAKYLLGMVLDKLWRDDEAKQAYEEAIKADANSAWAKLAKSALEI